MNIFLICAVMALGGFIQGATGFGFGLISIALLSLFMDVKEASVLLAFAGFIINAGIFMKLRSFFSFQRMWPILLATVFGVPFGVFLLISLDRQILRLVLGIILLVVVFMKLRPGHSEKKWHPLFRGIPCGMLSGVMAGAFGVGGPPAVAYTASQGFNRQRYVASVQLLLVSGAVVRIVSLFIGQALTTESVLLSLCGGGCAVLGSFCGLWMLKRISDSLLQKVIAVFLIIIAGKELMLVMHYFQ